MKKTVEPVKGIDLEPCECVEIQPLTELFSNGDLNILRDKINEIIARG